MAGQSTPVAQVERAAGPAHPIDRGGSAGEMSALSAALSSFFRLAGKARFRMQADHELEWSTFAILSPLADCGPLRSTALAEATHLDPSRISRMTSHLIELGHIERTPDAADGRASLLSVTPAGRDALVRLRRKREDFLGQLVAEWPAGDQERLADLLERLAADMARAMGCESAPIHPQHAAAHPQHPDETSRRPTTHNPAHQEQS